MHDLITLTCLYAMAHSDSAVFHLGEQWSHTDSQSSDQPNSSEVNTDLREHRNGSQSQICDGSPLQITLHIGIALSILSPFTIYPLFPPVQNALSSIRSQACDSTTSISFRVTVLSTASFDLLLCPWWEKDEKNGRRAATLRTSRVVNLVIRKSVPRHISIWIATLGSKPVCEARDSPWWPRKIILCTPADPGCVRLFIV